MWDAEDIAFEKLGPIQDIINLLEIEIKSNAYTSLEVQPNYEQVAIFHV